MRGQHACPTSYKRSVTKSWTDILGMLIWQAMICQGEHHERKNPTTAQSSIAPLIEKGIVDPLITYFT
jgi:hypothetical protein